MIGSVAQDYCLLRVAMLELEHKDGRYTALPLQVINFVGGMLPTHVEMHQ